MDVRTLAERNGAALRENPYPGRGIAIGLTPNGENFVQVYWIMGRSQNSRNRVFVREGDTVRTAPFDESCVEDPSLIIYNAVRSFPRCHVVSNGDQTDTVFEAMHAGRTFEEALFTRTFEPDAPNFTPRIAGVVNRNDPFHAYKLAILKAVDEDGECCTRQVFNYETPIPGIGHCVTTYREDGDPLPAFEGEPYVLELGDDVDEVAERYWEMLNEDNRVSLLAKFIDAETDTHRIRIINKHS
jgi:IMP cyclohydrolase